MMSRFVVIIALTGIAETVTGGNCPNLNSSSSCGDIRFCPHPDSMDWKCLKSVMNCDENNGIYYHCSRDVNGCYVHRCAKRVYCNPGQQPVLDPTKDKAMCQTCPEEEYQRRPFWSNEQRDCDYAKTKCDGQGEIECHPGTPTEDRTCRCDIQKNLALQGYAYNKRTCCSKDYDQECYCISFKEQCPPGKVRHFNYMCLPECPQGFYRQLDSEECISQNSSSHKNTTSAVQTLHQDSQVPTGIIIGLVVTTVLLPSVAALSIIYCLKHRQQRRQKAGGIEAPQIFCNGDSSYLRDSIEAPEIVKLLQEEKDSAATDRKKDRKKNKDAGNGQITKYNIYASGAIINFGGENNTQFKYIDIENLTQDTPESLNGSERASSITPEENLMSVNPEESRQEESILSNETSMDTEPKKPVEHEDMHPESRQEESILSNETSMDTEPKKPVEHEDIHPESRQEESILSNETSMDTEPKRPVEHEDIHPDQTPVEANDQTKRKELWSQPEVVLDDQTKRKEVWSTLDMVPDDQTKRKEVWSQPEVVLDEETKRKEVWSPLDMVPDDQTKRKEVWSPLLVANYQTQKEEPEISVSYADKMKKTEMFRSLGGSLSSRKTEISKPNEVHEANEQEEKSSMLSRSSDHENEDDKLMYEDLTRLKEIISAGPDNKEAVDIVDTIIKENDKRLKTEVLQYLAELLRCRIISREKHAKFRIFPGMTILPTQKIKFVCLYKGKLETKLPNFFGIDIHYKDIDIPEPLIDIEDHEKLNLEMTTDLDASLLQSAIEEHGDTLFKQHSNLQVICGGPFSIRNRRVVKQCTIILYCHAKGIIPYGEETFPSSLNFNGINIPVDIREGHFMLSVGRQEWHKNLCMGISIGEKGVGRAGTLGPFVDLGHNEYGFLTCAHVVGDVGKEVVQPSKGDSRGQKTEEETICGTVEKFVFEPDFCNRMNGLTKTGVDAALVKLTKDRGIEATNFAEVQEADLVPIGFTPETKFHYVGGGIGCPRASRKAQGKLVIKYGRTTGLSRGVMVLEGAMVKIDDIEQYNEKWNRAFILKGQYLVDGMARYQFAAPGDSGAGVFTLDDENKLTLIGLVAGGLDARFDHRCVVTPIEHILTALELNPDDLIFHKNIDID